MKNHKELLKLYRTQIESYPRLSQEEIVELYESEGINEESFEDKLKNYASLISARKADLALYKGEMNRSVLLATIRYGYETKKYSFEDIINNLENTIKNLRKIYSEIKCTYPILNEDKEIGVLLKKLSDLVELKKEDLTSQNDTDLNDIQTVLDELEKRVNKYVLGYGHYTHNLYSNIKKDKPKNRKFPSKELRNKIVCGTLGLALYLADKYYCKKDNTMPFEDLYQIACNALVSAAHYYIPSDRAKFTTYASKCIENQLRHEVYHKKKMKEQSCMPKDFFKKEQDNIKYIEMFLNSLKTKNSKGRTIYYSDKYGGSISSSLRDFKWNVKYYNHIMRLRGETDRLVPFVSLDKPNKSFNNILERIVKLLNNSKMKVLITDEDRELANLLMNYQGKPVRMQELYELLYCLELYSSKLDFIELYLNIEKELIDKNDGIVPGDEEILKEINKIINNNRKEFSKYKKNPSMIRYPFYVEYNDFYSEYKEQYGVDPFISPDTYELDDYSSKKKEYDDIVDDFDRDELIWAIDDIIDALDEIKTDKVVLYYSENIVQIYEEVSEYIEFKEYENCDIFSKEEARERLEIVKESISNFPAEDYVKIILKERKDTVKKILEEKNISVIEHNRRVAEHKDNLEKAIKYHKYLKLDRIATIKRDIELLFGDDNELLTLLVAGRNRGKIHQINVSLEDEALNNVFLNDYYIAVNELPELERDVLLRYYDELGYHNMSAKEIGAELGISETKVYNVKTRALKKLSDNKKLQSYKLENEG